MDGWMERREGKKSRKREEKVMKEKEVPIKGGRIGCRDDKRMERKKTKNEKNKRKRRIKIAVNNMKNN